MPKPDDFSQRAADFLKQWQTQMTRQMNDPDVIRAMLAAMQSFGAPAYDEPAKQPAHAPAAGDDAIRSLERRLVAVERQLTALAAAILPVASKTKNTTRTRNGGRPKPVAKSKRSVGKPKRAAAEKPKPGRKPKKR